MSVLSPARMPRCQKAAAAARICASASALSCSIVPQPLSPLRRSRNSKPCAARFAGPRSRPAAASCFQALTCSRRIKAITAGRNFLNTACLIRRCSRSVFSTARSPRCRKAAAAARSCKRAAARSCTTASQPLSPLRMPRRSRLAAARFAILNMRARDRSWFHALRMWRLTSIRPAMSRRSSAVRRSSLLVMSVFKPLRRPWDRNAVAPTRSCSFRAARSCSIVSQLLSPMRMPRRSRLAAARFAILNMRARDRSWFHALRMWRLTSIRPAMSRRSSAVRRSSLLVMSVFKPLRRPWDRNAVAPARSCSSLCFCWTTISSQELYPACCARCKNDAAARRLSLRRAAPSTCFDFHLLIMIRLYSVAE